MLFLSVPLMFRSCAWYFVHLHTSLHLYCVTLISNPCISKTVYNSVCHRFIPVYPAFGGLTSVLELTLIHNIFLAFVYLLGYFIDKEIDNRENMVVFIKFYAQLNPNTVVNLQKAVDY